MLDAVNSKGIDVAIRAIRQGDVTRARRPPGVESLRRGIQPRIVDFLLADRCGGMCVHPPERGEDVRDYPRDRRAQQWRIADPVQGRDR